MAKTFLDSKRGENGIVPPEAAAEYDRMEAEMVSLGKEIERLERQTALDAELAKATSTPITNQPNRDSGEEKTGRASGVYTKAFWNAMRGKNIPEIQNALQIGTDSKGGFLVPEEFERTLIEGLEEENVVRQFAHVILSDNDKKIPVVATRGSGSWVDEEGLIPESDDAFGQVTLTAFKAATTIKVSSELLQDSAFDVESYIARSFARRIGSTEEEAFISGNGTGKPTGILNGAQLGVTTASATFITLDEVMDLFYSLKSPYRRKAVFLTNESTIKALRKLKDANGQYLWAPSVQQDTPDSILGRSIYLSSFMPELGTGKKTMAFGDFDYYWIADRQGRTFKRLDELYAQNDQVGFIGTQRVDAKVILPEAIKYLAMKS